MDYSMQGSRDSYASQVHNLYPYPQPSVYPPPNSQGYQSYFGQEDPSSYSRWSEQPVAPSDDPYYSYGYQDDPDCLTFLRGCFAGLCCCCLLGRCCY